MSKYIIPLDSIPNQKFDVALNNQRCRFEFITRGPFLYMNLSINEVPKINGMICLNKVDLVQYIDYEFDGKIYFEDLQGNADPLFYGLGERWQLVYEEE